MMANQVELEQDHKPDQALHDQEQHGLAHGDGAGRDRAAARARHRRVDIAVDNVVEGAARAAHHQRADAEQRPHR